MKITGCMVNWLRYCLDHEKKWGFGGDLYEPTKSALLKRGLVAEKHQTITNFLTERPYHSVSYVVTPRGLDVMCEEQNLESYRAWMS